MVKKAKKKKVSTKTKEELHQAHMERIEVLVSKVDGYLGKVIKASRSKKYKLSTSQRHKILAHVMESIDLFSMKIQDERIGDKEFTFNDMPENL